MIKAIATRDNGGKVIVFGLSDLNLKRLREGRPIAFDGMEIGVGAEFLIYFGETEAELAALLTPEFLEWVMKQPRGKRG
jgi:RIO-like serine/threonine protein kinase